MENDSIVLFLDHEPQRAALMYRRMPADLRHRTIWVTKAEEAIEVLQNYKARLELVFLDHDLGGETYVHSGREDCGMEVIRFLEKQDSDEYSGCKFVIHSWNISAAEKMHDRLVSKGYHSTRSPFGS